MTALDGRAAASAAPPAADARAPGDSPASAFSWAAPSVWSGFAIVASLAGIASLLHGAEQPSLALSVLFGAAFGIVLQRARFCFFCNFRDWYDARDPRGLHGILVALGVGVVGYALVFGAWLPDSSSGRLPPDAFIGPVGPALVLAGLAFGAGMAVSGSCISAHLYRLGEGSPTAPFALAGAFAGFMLGFLSWNTLYPVLVADAPVMWLPAWLGYAGTTLFSLAMLGALAWALAHTAAKQSEKATRGDAWATVFLERWPSWLGGAIVGVLGMVAYLRVAPLGVTAEISGRAREVAQGLGVAPLRLEGLDTLRGCVSVVRDAVLSNNGAFVLALVAASFAAALAGGQFTPSWPSRGQAVRGLLGGVLLGWGAMIGLGCTVGTLLSGIMAGALSGWVFGAAVFAGVAATLAAGRRLGLL